jgi:hypothetical protein
LLVAGVVSFMWLPVIAVAVVAGIALSWRVPAGIGALALFVYGNARLEARRLTAGARPIAWPLKMVVSVVACTTVGGLLAGGAFGAFLGLMLGVPLGLPPLSVKNKDGVVAPFDPHDRVQRTEMHKSWGLVMAGLVVVFAVALLIGLLISRFA